MRVRFRETVKGSQDVRALGLVLGLGCKDVWMLGCEGVSIRFRFRFTIGVRDRVKVKVNGKVIARVKVKVKMKIHFKF